MDVKQGKSIWERQAVLCQFMLLLTWDSMGSLQEQSSQHKAKCLHLAQEAEAKECLWREKLEIDAVSSQGCLEAHQARNIGKEIQRSQVKT